MTQLSRFVLGCCFLLFVSGSLQANEISNSTSSDETSPLNITLGPEEQQYILKECETFADEDNISLDKRSEYIKTCIDELSIAVKHAIDKLHSKSNSLVTSNIESEATED